jgi:hypothetical protein
MTTFATIVAVWAIGCAAAVAAAYRFGEWLDRKADPDRVTRWVRESPAHGETLAGGAGANHGEK